MAIEVMNRAAQMFPQLTPAQIDRIATVGRRRDVPAGEVLIEAGDQNSHFFVILSGALEVVRLIGEREEPVTVHRDSQFTGCGNNGIEITSNHCTNPPSSTSGVSATQTSAKL